jgi:quinol monooxygenase YgiN
MAHLTIIANIKAKAEQVELVKTELLKLLETTRAEEGCINYDLHQDNRDPAHFVFHENWSSRDLMKAHLNAPHLAAFRVATEGAIESFSLSELTQIG